MKSGEKFKKGQIVKVVGNNNNHSYPIGTIWKVAGDYHDECALLVGVEDGKKLNDSVVMHSDLILCRAIEFFEQEKARLIKEVESCDDKIAFVKAAGVEDEEFRPDEYRVWAVMQQFQKEGASDIEKARAIAELIRKS